MGARFKLDENLPHDAALILRNRGHDVHTVLDEQLGGHTDEQVLDAARVEDRILVTYDLDFSNIRIYPQRTTPVSGSCGRIHKASRAL